MDDITLMLIAGTVIATLSLLLHIRKRFAIDAKQKKEQQQAVKAYHEREIKQLKQSGTPVKPKSSVSSKRIPLPDAVTTVFNGSYTPQNIAKWEVEIDQIGRSVSARIDMKMIALQTLTMEADRAASRLEILIEHLETLIKGAVPSATLQPLTEEKQVLQDIKEIIQEEIIEEIQEEKLPETNAEMSGNLIRSSETENIQTKTFSEVFSQLEDNPEYTEAEKRKETPEPVTVIPSSPAITPATVIPENPLSLSPSRLPSDTISPASIKIRSALSSQNYTVPFVKQSAKTEKRPRNALSLDTLYNGTTYKNSGTSAARDTVSSSTASEIELSSHLSLRRQAETLADSGYTANQIAQTLNITVGEVDLMLSLRRE